MALTDATSVLVLVLVIEGEDVAEVEATGSE